MTRESVIECYLMNSPKCVAEMLYDTITKYENQISDLQAVIEKQAERIRYVESQLRLHYEE